MLETDGPRSSGVTVRGSGKTYSYDRVFGRDADQGMVYQDVAGHVLDEVLQGYNCTVFAYGQTGSGKTYTMTGTPDEPGVIPCAVADVFAMIREDPTREFLLRVSYLEIYN